MEKFIETRKFRRIRSWVFSFNWLVFLIEKTLQPQNFFLDEFIDFFSYVAVI